MAGPTSSCRFTQPYGLLITLDELDIQLGHVAHAHGPIAVQVRVFYLAIDKFSPLMQREARSPKGRALRLRQGAIRVHNGSFIDDDGQFV